MNRVGQVLSASTLAAVSFGGASQAAIEFVSEDGQSHQLHSIVGKRLTVVPLHGLQSSDPLHQVVKTEDPHSAQARRLQAAIIADPKLMRHMESHQVDVTSIVGLAQADDGSVTVFTSA